MYYFVKVPKLQKDVSHQMGTVEIIEYTVKEGSDIKPGQTIAIVENWWARMALKAVSSGYISKTFFTQGAHVLIGDPFTIIVCDPDDGPNDNDTCEVEIIDEHKRKTS